MQNRWGGTLRFNKRPWPGSRKCWKQSHIALTDMCPFTNFLPHILTYACCFIHAKSPSTPTRPASRAEVMIQHLTRPRCRGRKPCRYFSMSVFSIPPISSNSKADQNFQEG